MENLSEKEMFGLRPGGSEGINMGQLGWCADRSNKCKGPEAKTCLVCERSMKEASVAGTALVRRIEAGAEVREAWETRLDRALRTGVYSRRERETLEGFGLRSTILGD